MFTLIYSVNEFIDSIKFKSPNCASGVRCPFRFAQEG